MAKLKSVYDIKQDQRQVLTEKGAIIPENLPFAEYAGVIRTTAGDGGMVGTGLPKYNLTAVVKPTEDDYEGYAPGSIWLYNIAAGDSEQIANMFICVSVADNKAVWVRCASNAFFLSTPPRQPDTEYVVLGDGIIEADKAIMS